MHEVFSSGRHMNIPTVYVPIGSGEAYRNANVWKDFFIQEDEHVDNERPDQKEITIFNVSGGISLSCVGPVQVVVYSVSGQIVYQKRLTGQLDIPLKKGFYIIKADNVTKKIYVE